MKKTQKKSSPKKDARIQKKIWSVVNNVFLYDTNKGHLKWKISDIARASGIARTSIYYYFGNTKSQIFESCFAIVAKSFYGLDNGETVKRIGLTKAAWVSKQIMDRNPSIMAFMYKWRHKSSPLQARLIDLETKFQNRILDDSPHLERHQVLALHSMFHGLTTSTFLDEKGLATVIDLIERIKSGRLKLI